MSFVKAVVRLQFHEEVKDITSDEVISALCNFDNGYDELISFEVEQDENN